MAYKRVVVPDQPLQGNELTAALVGIGMNFAAPGAAEPNLEDALLGASVEGMEHDDLRVLSVLVTWLGIHHPWINADRMVRAARAQRAVRVRCFWSAVGVWLHRDRRLARLADLYDGPRLPLLRAGNAFQVKRKGEDERFSGGPLQVPAGVLRDRDRDVLSPTELAKRHRSYYYRVLMGPSYRADMWAALERDPTLSAAELARLTYGSFASAWQVRHDWALLVAQGEVMAGLVHGRESRT